MTQCPFPTGLVKTLNMNQTHILRGGIPSQKHLDVHAVAGVMSGHRARFSDGGEKRASARRDFGPR